MSDLGFPKASWDLGLNRLAGYNMWSSWNTVDSKLWQDGICQSIGASFLMNWRKLLLVFSVLLSVRQTLTRNVKMFNDLFYFLFPCPGKRSRAWWVPIGDDMGTKLKQMHTVENFFLSTRLRWMLTWCGAKPKAMLYDLLSSGGEQARIAEIGCCEAYQIRILPWRLDHHQNTNASLPLPAEES